MKSSNKVNYISYATANDDELFYYDRINFFRMAVIESGVKNIEIFISISIVNDVTVEQYKVINSIISDANKMSLGKININDVEFKSNIGRDFSSHACNLRKIAKNATDGDSVFFLNRSAYGPLVKNWYLSYLNQGDKYDNIAICGSTINLSGHPDILSPKKNQTHVQTYAFLSSFPFLSRFLDFFPAEKCVERLDVIKNGEIAFSQEALLSGYQITSLAWPGIAFSNQSTAEHNYPTYDIKSDLIWVKNLPFRYKFDRYNKKILSLFPVIKSNLLRFFR